MNSLNGSHRRFVVLGAILIQIALGAIYAWSVYTRVLVEAGWTRTQTQFIFSTGLAVFAVVMVITGRILPKIGPRKLALASGLTLGLGYILSGLTGAENFTTTLLFIGVMGGAGIGLGYVIPIAVAMRWFPDKKGLITGLAVAGFGFGATLWMATADRLGTLGGGELIERVGISNTFIIYGMAYLILVSTGSIWMVFPPEGWKPENWVPPVATKSDSAGTINFSSRKMMQTPQYYFIFLTFTFSAAAGLMSIGLMRLWPQEALTRAGVSPAEAGAAATMAMAVFFALFNGLGRITWGLISDIIGRKKSIIIMMTSQGLFIILFQWLAGNVTTLYIMSMFIGFNFGGNFALFPTITADTFGTKHVGQNYGWVFLAYAAGGILGPIMGGRLGDLNNFPLAFTICGILCFVAVFTVAMVVPARMPADKTISKKVIREKHPTPV